MYIKYGSYAHTREQASLMSLTVRPLLSERGFRKSIIAEATVHGEFIIGAGDDQYDISTLISGLEAAFSVDGQDWGLYHDDNTPTPHFLDSDHPDSLTGNQVVMKSFPANHGGEYATGREFAYTIRNEFMSAESLILEYQETISHQGTAGPRVEWTEFRTGPPLYRVQSEQSIQTIRQSGYAVTIGTYLDPPPPILPPPYELQHLRTISRTTPTRFPQGFMGYKIHWDYVYNTPTVAPAFPTTR